jgi:hypothetical protein
LNDAVDIRSLRVADNFDVGLTTEKPAERLRNDNVRLDEIDTMNGRAFRDPDRAQWFGPFPRRCGILSEGTSNCARGVFSAII